MIDALQKFQRLREPEYGVFHPALGPCELCGKTGTRQLYREDSDALSDIIKATPKEEMNLVLVDYYSKYSMSLCDEHTDEWLVANGWVKSDKYKCFVRPD